MKRAIAIPKSSKVSAQTKIRPFRHTFDTPGTQVPTLPVNLGVPAMGQKMHTKSPKVNLTPHVYVFKEPKVARAPKLRNRSGSPTK